MEIMAYSVGPEFCKTWEGMGSILDDSSSGALLLIHSRVLSTNAPQDAQIQFSFGDYRR